MQTDSRWIRHREDDENTQPIPVPLPPQDIQFVQASIYRLEKGSGLMHNMLLDLLGIFPVHALNQIYVREFRR